MTQLLDHHNPVMLNSHCSSLKTSPSVTNRLINWKIYKENLNSQSIVTNPKTTTNLDIDLVIASFTNSNKSAIESSTYIRLKNQTINNIPTFFLSEIEEKNCFRRVWPLFCNQSTKRKLNSKIVCIRLVLQIHKQNEWDNFLFSLSIKDNSI